MERGKKGKRSERDGIGSGEKKSERDELEGKGGGRGEESARQKQDN